MNLNFYKGKFKSAIPVFIFILFNFAGSQIKFYSQSEKIAERNLHYLINKFEDTRKIIPLHGEYEILDPRSGQLISRVKVPSVFHSQKTLIFRKTLPALDTKNAHYLLHFAAINGKADVSLNQGSLFSGSLNFLPLTFRLQDSLLKDTSNILEITVEPWKGQSGQFPPWIPMNLPRIDNGITRSVYLEKIPDTFIERLLPSVNFKGDKAEIGGRVFIQSHSNLAGNYWLDVTLEKNGRSVLSQRWQFIEESGRKSHMIEFKLNSIKIERWTPQSPHLYALKLLLSHDNKVLDKKSRSIPLRTVRIEGNKILLNGNLIQINGINYVYQDSRGIGLMNSSLLREDLTNIKAQGFNAVRVGFYPQSPLFYHLTDSLGLLCFQDLPFSLFRTPLFSDSLNRTRCFEYLNEFYKTACSFSSIIAIGLGNCSASGTMNGIDPPTKHSDSFFTKQQYISYVCSFTPREIKSSYPDIVCLEIVKRNNLKGYINRLIPDLSVHKPLLLSCLSKAVSYRIAKSTLTFDLKQTIELLNELDDPSLADRFSGQFIFTYSDYILQTPALQAGPLNKFRKNTLGIYTLKRELKNDIKPVFQDNKRILGSDRVISEKQKIETYAFVFVGLINFLVFLVFYRSLVDFRRNIFRSIRRPHGFFVDLQERRLIPFGESFFLVLILSVNGAVLVGSFLYFFRNNLYMDYLLSLILPFNQVKLMASHIIWQPFYLLPVLACIFALFFFFMAVPIRFTGFFSELQIRSNQAIAISSWAASPLLIFLPFGMFFYNLLLAMKSYWILVTVLLYFCVWYFLRWINGTRVITEFTYTRVFIYFFLTVAVFTGTLFYFLQNRIDLLSHLEFIFHLYRSLT